MEPTSPPDLYDSHTHLNEAAFDGDLPAVLERARRQGVREMLVVGYDLESSARAVALARKYGLHAAVGIQPHLALQTGPREIAHLEALAQDPTVVALGEIGLDYYRDRSPRPRQRHLFRSLLSLARTLGLPVVIHCREAFADLLEDLSREGTGWPGVMHCFSGTAEQAREFLALGLYLSLAGPVTYPHAPKLWQVAREVPLDRLLLETDCPWLPPQPHRGERNEPAYLIYTAARVAELRGTPLEVVARATSYNARTLFGGKRPAESR
ncbi:MAG: TatD family hydrolase [Chloroflexia bacterium]